jgi:hypothetical protein
MSVIPDGADSTVAKMAIAWEIAKDAMGWARDAQGNQIESHTERVDVFTELFNKAFYSLMKGPDKKQLGG